MLSKLLKSICIIFFLILNFQAFPAEKKIDKKKIVIELIKSIETRDPKSVKYVDTKKYRDHNQNIKLSIKGFNKIRSKIPKSLVKVNTIRAFEDGNFVFAHTIYNFETPKIGFDIFRFENGKVIEHWGGLTKKIDNTKPEEGIQVKGTTQVKDLKQSKTNKKIILKFIEIVLIKKKYTQANQYIEQKNFQSHNTQIGNYFSSNNSLNKNEIANKNITQNYEKNIRVLGEGNFVFSVSEGSIACDRVTYYDLFRVEKNKIVEHWDVIENITPKS